MITWRSMRGRKRIHKLIYLDDMIIAVDFDGTLHDGQYPVIGKPKPGAAEVMRRFKNEGHYLILWSCRTGEPLIDAVNWMAHHNIPFSRVNDHNPENVALYGDAGKKVFAHLYIDDRQIGGLPDWEEIERYVYDVHSTVYTDKVIREGQL